MSGRLDNMLTKLTLIALKKYQLWAAVTVFSEIGRTFMMGQNRKLPALVCMQSN